MNAVLHIIQAGPITTIQDHGRRGYQCMGVPVAGAMDLLALSTGNRLLGNAPDAAGIEIALSGLRARVGGGSIRVAVAGAARLSVNGTDLGSWVAATVSRGQTLSVAPTLVGQFGYLAIAGGLKLPGVLGSLATHMRAGIGPIDGGRGLAVQDRIPVLALRDDATPPVALPQRLIPRAPARIRVVTGPQDGFFTAQTMARFLESRFTISRQSDRMGYRLEGPSVHAEGAQNIISEGIAPGSIQIPGSGQPIVLMADRQTVGGYPKIATVISSDIGWVAQMRPGETLGFEAVTPARAVAIRRAQEAALMAIRPEDHPAPDTG